MKNSKKITFMINGVGLNGGLRVILTHAHELQKRGHTVTLVMPQNRRTGSQGIEEVQIPWFPLRARAITVPIISDAWVPDADIIVATAWKTAEWVHPLPVSKGTKFYLIQNYETWDGDIPKLHATYKLPFRKIVISSWLKKLIEETFHEECEGPVVNGVDQNVFYRVPLPPSSNPRIGMLYHLHRWKGVGDGVKAFKLVQKRFPHARLVMFGTSRPRLFELPRGVEFHHDPPQSTLKEIYSSLTVFVSPSWFEGCQLPPMEAMACQCPVVATEIGGIPDYSIPGQSALTVPPKNFRLLAEQIMVLLEDPEKRAAVAEKGYQTISQFTWEKASAQLEQILLG